MNICDRCGSKVEDSKDDLTTVFNSFKSEFTKENNYDLCKRCKKELNKLIDKFMVEIK